MWSLKITTEQRYCDFKDILPDIRCNILLFIRAYYKSSLYLTAVRNGKSSLVLQTLGWIIQYFNSFIIERTLDNQYQITFYE